MDNIWVSYLAGVASIVALMISIYNSLIEKKRLITEIITKNRIEWISEVRTLLGLFLEYYNNSNAKEMQVTYGKLSLYMNSYNSKYDKLLSAISVCINDKSYNAEHINAMIKYSQDVLSSVWTRMKREAGVSQANEIDLLIKLDEESKAGPIS